MSASLLTAMPLSKPVRSDIPAPASAPGCVRVQAPGRLHLGFLDPGASLGRAYGSLGLVIDGYETIVELGAAAGPCDSVAADDPAARAEVDRAVAHLHQLRLSSGRQDPLRLRLLQVLPPHAGFGSGTQLALAIGHAFAQWHGLDLDSATLARWLGRGVRSGIGIAGFDGGGLLLDGGPGAGGVTAPLLARIPLPEAWRVVVVQDLQAQGLSGSLEKQALAELPPLPRTAAAEICHQVLMRVLPGASEAEFEPFASGLTHIQQILGDHFAPAQANSAYTSPAVGQLVQWMGEASRVWTHEAAGADDLRHEPAGPRDHRGQHGAAIGQSSWGPTGFVILPSQAQAESLLDSARSAGLVGPSLDVRIVRGRNAGAVVFDSRRASVHPTH